MSIIYNLLHEEIFVQTLGFLGITAGLVSFHMKNRRRILVFQIICSTLFALQLFLLEAYSGAVINLIGILRGIIYSMKERYPWASSSAVPCIMIALFITTGLVTVGKEGPVSLLPSLAMTVQSVAQFSENERRIRFLSIFASPFWITYHFISGSIGGWVGEIFMLISIITSLITYKKSDTDVTVSEK